MERKYVKVEVLDQGNSAIICLLLAAFYNLFSKILFFIVQFLIMALTAGCLP